MPTDNDLVVTIREILRRIAPNGVADTLAVASELVAEFERLGDVRAIDDVRSLIRLEAAVIGVSVVDH
jgi:hypothetical protein